MKCKYLLGLHIKLKYLAQVTDFSTVRHRRVSSMYRINRYLQTLIVAFVIVALNGCGSPKLDPIGDGGTILAFGDSLTVGVGTSKTNSYPSVLEELTKLNVINSGVSGETSDIGLKRFTKEMDRVFPDLVILIEGGNDILQNRNHSEIEENIKGMIEIAVSRGVPVVLIGIPAKNLFSSSAPFYEELAEQFQLVFDGTLIGSLQRSPQLKSDHVHFNKKGYRKMAEAIYELLQENGAL